MFVATIKDSRLLHIQVSTLISIGITGFRVNPARVQLRHSIRVMQYLRRLEELLNCDIKIFIDLPGPKARLGRFSRGAETLAPGQSFVIDVDFNSACTESRAYSQARLHETVRIGDRLITSGGAMMAVTAITDQEAVCQVIDEGKVYSMCGITIDGRYIENKNLTNLDLEVIEMSRDIADYICPSFSDSSQIIDQVRKASPHPVKVVAKIESPVGASRLREIACVADGLMLARGDLSAYYSRDQIRSIGIELANIGRQCGVVVVLATDYFRSMVNGHSLSAKDYVDLARDLALDPDFLIINETSYSRFWQQIALTAAAMGRQR